MKFKGVKFCIQVFVLCVEVIENFDYVMKVEWEYGFNIIVYIQCFDNKEKFIVEYVEDGKGFLYCMFLQLFFNNIFFFFNICIIKIFKNVILEILLMNFIWQLIKNGYDFKYFKIIIFLIYVKIKCMDV